MDLSSLTRNLDDYVSTLKGNPEAALKDLISFLRSLLNDLGIKVTYEPPATYAEREDTKIVLSVNKNTADFDIPLVRECGGIVISVRHRISGSWTWEWLAIPPGEFGPTPSKRGLKNALARGKYTVFEAVDGTTVCLYHHGGKWLMSTKNGYEVSTLSWRGITYDKALKEVLSTYEGFDWHALDVECCYTIGFRHPNHHPFQPSKRAWFIDARNTSTLESAENTTGLPSQVIVETPKNIMDLAENALAHWESTKEANFGYVLRSHDDRRPDLFIESTLLCRIREFVYHIKFIRDRNRRMHVKKMFADISYVVLRAYLDPVRRELFIRMFPQFQTPYDNLEVFINKLVQKVVQPKADFDVNPDFLKRIKIFLEDNHPRISARTRPGIIKDILTNPQLLDLYAEFLVN